MAKGLAASVAFVVFGLLLVNKLVAISPAARAQEVAPAPPTPGTTLALPGSSMPIRSGSTAAATIAGAARDVGITEQGRGVVSLPADRLRLTIRSFGNLAPRTPGASPAAGTLDDVEKAVVDTMRANGIPDARVETPVLGNIAMNDQFVGTIAKPTHDSVSAIETRIVSSLPPAALPFLRNVQVQGALEVDDCSAAIDRARIAAFADARKRAEALASAAGAHLGGLIGASETDQSGGCPSPYNAYPYYGNNANDTLEKTTVDVAVTLSATFALRP
jgi:uncharacterized protein YggE